MIMPFIEDETLFKAVSFSSSMVKKGKSVPLACRIAASYYKINDSDVSSEIGKRGASVSNYRRKYAK
jgi:hypothetical protein